MLMLKVAEKNSHFLWPSSKACCSSSHSSVFSKAGKPQKRGRVNLIGRLQLSTEKSREEDNDGVVQLRILRTQVCWCLLADCNVMLNWRPCIWLLTVKARLELGRRSLTYLGFEKQTSVVFLKKLLVPLYKISLLSFGNYWPINSSQA